MAWVSKVREYKGVAADLFIYMDDFRPTGPNAEDLWSKSRRASRICNLLIPQVRLEHKYSISPW
jgi:hypothetical protein